MLNIIHYFASIVDIDRVSVNRKRRDLLLLLLRTNFPLRIPHVSTLLLVLKRAIERKLSCIPFGTLRIRKLLPSPIFIL